jgi:mono/diheme cytochrome c family protein
MKKILSMLTFFAIGFVTGGVNGQTYTAEVADIINNNCVVCHREGGIGPMSFETYEQVRPWAPLIALKVANREMPPYAYDRGIGIQDSTGRD